MSDIGSMFGLGGGAGGSGFAPPAGVTQEQLNNAYNQTQAGIQQQQDFVTALAGQNGLGNQSQVFNQLQGVANGTGPNPAQAQLANTTAANVANQAAMMAGQRGASQNTGLIARQAAQQGANIQQQSAGQAAALQAGQSLNAINSMGNIANTQVGQMQTGLSGLNQSQLQQQQNLLNMQGNINQANASMAGTRMGQQPGMIGNLMGAVGSVGNLFGGSGGGLASTPGADMAGGAGDASGLIGSGEMLAAKGGMIHKMADGGDVNPTAQLQNVQSQSVTAAPEPSTNPSTGPSSAVGQHLSGQMPSGAAQGQPAAQSGGGNPLGGMGNMAGTAMKGLMNWGEHEALPYIEDFFSGLGGAAAGLVTTAGPAMAGGAADSIGAAAPEIVAGIGTVAPALAEEGAAVAAAEGGQVPALVSPGEQYLRPNDVKKVKKGANPLKVGERIPGTPKHPGNNYANDIVPKKLEEGGIVIPNSVMQSKNPHWEAMKFVHATIAKNKHKSKK